MLMDGSFYLRIHPSNSNFSRTIIQSTFTNFTYHQTLTCYTVHHGPRESSISFCGRHKLMMKDKTPGETKKQRIQREKDEKKQIAAENKKGGKKGGSPSAETKVEGDGGA